MNQIKIVLKRSCSLVPPGDRRTPGVCLDPGVMLSACALFTKIDQSLYSDLSTFYIRKHTQYSNSNGYTFCRLLTHHLVYFRVLTPYFCTWSTQGPFILPHISYVRTNHNSLSRRNTSTIHTLFRAMFVRCSSNLHQDPRLAVDMDHFYLQTKHVTRTVERGKGE